jgi:tRNA pseudouridine55 synthase
MNTGFLLINKPTGPTSHNIISRLRKITGIKRIGHAGTLDPFASGLLIVAVGRESTKKLGKFLKMDKTYLATLHLGAETDTFDREGKRSEKCEVRSANPKEEEINQTLSSFIGRQKQIPPMYSAKKINGKKLYELARKGIEIERQPVDIEIYDLKLINYKYPALVIEVSCSSGTYIRSLAVDMGRKLETGAYLEELERTSISSYKLETAVDIENLNTENWQKYLQVLDI